MLHFTVPHVACIIPVVGSTEGLEATLLSVLERRPADCEIIVVANVAYDDPYGLQGEIQILNAPSATGLVECINLGIQAAQSPIVHILATGFQASDGWLDRITEYFDDPLVAAVAPAIYDIATPHGLMATGVAYRSDSGRTLCRSAADASNSAQTPIGPLLQAAFYRKSVVDSLGGISAAVGDELADIDLVLTLRHAGWKICEAPDSRVLATSLAVAPPASSMATSKFAERFYWRHADTSWTKRAIMHPIAVAIETIFAKPWWNAPARALGRLLAFCHFGHYAEYRQQLAACYELRLAVETESLAAQPPILAFPKNAAGNIQRIDAGHEAVRQHPADRSRSTLKSSKRSYRRSK
ncbi:MAG TPA: glycosyltransferase [Pirellulales bacterium]